MKLSEQERSDAYVVCETLRGLLEQGKTAAEALRHLLNETELELIAKIALYYHDPTVLTLKTLRDELGEDFLSYDDKAGFAEWRINPDDKRSLKVVYDNGRTTVAELPVGVLSDLRHIHVVAKKAKRR